MRPKGSKNHAPRVDKGKRRKPQTGSGNHAARGTIGNKGGGRRPGRTLLLPVMSLPEETADFVRFEQARRDADPRETVKALLSEQAILFHERRRAAIDPAYFVGKHAASSARYFTFPQQEK